MSAGIYCVHVLGINKLTLEMGKLHKDTEQATDTTGLANRDKDTDEETGPSTGQRKSQALITGTTKDLLEEPRPEKRRGRSRKKTRVEA